MHRITRRSVQERAADEPHDIAIALFRRREQHDGGKVQRNPAIGAASIVGMVAKGNIDLATDNRLQPVLRCLLRKLKRTEQIVGVGDCDSRRLVGNRLFDDLAERQCAFQQGIGRVYPQMHETWRQSTVICCIGCCCITHSIDPDHLPSHPDGHTSGAPNPCIGLSRNRFRSWRRYNSRLIAHCFKHEPHS